MTPVPGTIDLGKFRVVYEEAQAHGADGYLLQQRAIIRLNEALVKIEQPEDFAVYCDDDKFKKQHGRRPSPLQYFIASIGFCMFSQFKRLAVKAGVPLKDLEMDLRMTYDLSGGFAGKNFSQAVQGLRYAFRVDSGAPAASVMQVALSADKGCHTVNSLRRRMTVAGTLVLNDRELPIGD